MGRSETRKEFDEANLKFQNKWKQVNDEAIDEFLTGFEKTWVKSNESNWWSGAGPIDHNNGLEAKNRDIKQNKTLRPKQRLGDFFVNAFDIVKQMSIDDEAERIYSKPTELITPTQLNEGWQWLLRHQEKADIVQIKDGWYVLSESYEGSESLVDKAKELIRSKRNSYKDLTFDQYAKLKASVYELKKEDVEVSCNCPVGIKKNFCKHVVGMMIKEKLITVPENILALPLAAKVKRGRPKKSRGALSHI